MPAHIVCDDPDEAAFLSLAVQRLGLPVLLFPDVDRALRAGSERPAELWIVAARVGRPADHARRLRAEGDAPIVIVSNSANEDVLCQALDGGADWVQARPYSARLLVSQLRALLRRSKETTVLALPELRVGDISLDTGTRSVTVKDGRPRRLTPLEFRLLYTLMAYRGQTVPTQTLIERMWGYEGEGSADLARGVVSRLRAKIEERRDSPQYIITVPGVGYTLAAPAL